MFTTILQQITETNPVFPQSQHAERPSERHPHLNAYQPAPWENPLWSGNVTGGPFAAELDVIQQQAHNAGPGRASLIPDPDVRHKDGERSFHHSTFAFPADHRSRSPSQQLQHAVLEGSKVKCGEEGHFRRKRPPSPIAQHIIGARELGPSISKGRRMNQGSQSEAPHVGHTTSRGPSLMISLTVNGLPVQAMVDTGAETTVISEGLYQHFHPNEQTALKKTCLRNAESGKEMTAIGGLKDTFQLGTRSFKWEVYVAPIRNHVLLGFDLLRAADITIHASRKAFIDQELLPAKIVGGWARIPHSSSASGKRHYFAT
ncbi:hypothetical protein SRHO_G00054080 [Serrasalmus rhombeus]